mmetsp:Transcript_24555/g.45143  ORF Transcript_24555/g.45143 Transcript_24555/m.45143 type:complete len:427 (+) Transcript_24555:143-1423(+)
MAPRGTSKKRRTPHHRDTSNRYRTTSSSAPLINDDDPNKIHLLGTSFPNPLSYLRQNFSSPIINWSPTRILLVGGITAILLAPLFDTFLRESLAFLRNGSGGSGDDANGIVGASLPHVTNDGKFHGRYPNSLLTLFFPYTLYRDVVLDQPVSPDDVPFFWHAHVSDETAIKSILTKCFEADLVELNTVEDVEKAKRLNLVSTLAEQDRVGIGAINKENLYNGQRRKPLVIASPHIREAAELFSQDNFGRTFSFYRHPIDYDVHPNLKKKLPPEAGANNFMTRLLSDVHVGVLGYKELGIGKQVIRQTTIAGTRDLMTESMFRMGKYYGWVPVGGEGTKESEGRDDAIAMSCIDDIVKDVPGERYADHNSPEWQVFYKANKLDCQLYEIARSTWRAQIQTIVPFTVQKRRAGEGDDDEKEEEEEEER